MNSDLEIVNLQAQPGVTFSTSSRASTRRRGASRPEVDASGREREPDIGGKF